MATVQANEHLFSRHAMRTYVHDPADATVAAYIAWVDMRDFSHFAALAALVSGTGILTFKIFAATDSSGTSATLVKAHSDPTPADAAGDNVVLEVSVEQVRAVLSAARYVSVEMDCDAAGDIVTVTYIRCASRHAYRALTADVIA